MGQEAGCNFHQLLKLSIPARHPDRSNNDKEFSAPLSFYEGYLSDISII